MNHGVFIDFLDVFADPFLEFNQSGNPDVSKKSPAHLGKKGLAQVSWEIWAEWLSRITRIWAMT